MEGLSSIFATPLDFQAPAPYSHDDDFGSGANPRLTVGGRRPPSALYFDNPLRAEIRDRPTGFAHETFAPDRSPWVVA